jgi:hypothetical protein
VTCKARWETFESVFNPDDLPHNIADRLHA